MAVRSRRAARRRGARRDRRAGPAPRARVWSGSPLLVAASPCPGTKGTSSSTPRGVPRARRARRPAREIGGVGGEADVEIKRVVARAMQDAAIPPMTTKSTPRAMSSRKKAPGVEVRPLSGHASLCRHRNRCAGRQLEERCARRVFPPGATDCASSIATSRGRLVSLEAGPRPEDAVRVATVGFATPAPIVRSAAWLAPMRGRVRLGQPRRQRAPSDQHLPGWSRVYLNVVYRERL